MSRIFFIVFNQSPMKIISLVPSITELLVDLGLENNIVGITKYCVHPQHLLHQKNSIGGTKTLDLTKIKALNADLIIANKEENQKEQILELQETEPIWITDIRTIQDNWDFIREVGLKTNTLNKAKILISEGEKLWAPLKNIFKAKKVLYFIWRKPYMTIGKNTFINSILSELGLQSISTTLAGNYPEVSPEWILQQNIDFILLSSEPYPFKEKHLSEFIKLNPDATPILIDGEMCSWYGSRMLKAPHYFKTLSVKILDN